MNDTPSIPRSSPTPDDETRPLGSQAAGQQTLERGPEPPAADAPAPPPGYAPYGVAGGQPGYAAYPGFPGHPPPERPRFRDQVLGMRAVIAVALVALLIGGLGGALLGTVSEHGGDDGRFGGPGGGFPPGGFGQGQQGRLPQQQFQQSQP